MLKLLDAVTTDTGGTKRTLKGLHSQNQVVGVHCFGTFTGNVNVYFSNSLSASGQVLTELPTFTAEGYVVVTLPPETIIWAEVDTFAGTAVSLFVSGVGED